MFLFVDGINPYNSEIILMPQSFDRYDRFLQHERETKTKELVLLQRAFPESGLKSTMIGWDGSSLPDKEVTLRVDKAGNFAAPAPRASIACPGGRMKKTLIILELAEMPDEEVTETVN